MSDITQIQVGETIYNIADNIARRPATSTYAGLLTDVPNDDKKYARKNQEWVDLDNLIDKKLNTDATTSLSGSILTFDSPVTNGIKDLTVGIEPVQDLHGYDHPWPGGSGKNLMDYENFISVSDKARCTASVDTSGTITVNCTESGSLWIGLSATIGGTIPSNAFTIPASQGNTFVSSGIGYSYIYYEVDANNVVLASTEKQHGISYTVTDSQCTKLGFRLVIGSKTSGDTITGNTQMEKGSTATAWSPYSNICPISGHATATVTRTGKNLFDISQISDGSISGLVYTVSDGIITYSGTALSNGWKSIYNFYLPKVGTYHFHMEVTGDGGAWLENWTNKNQDVTITCTDTSVAYRITLPNTTSGQSYSGTIKNIQVEYASSATFYEPYQGTSVTIDLGETRYGGSINVLTGEMTVTKVFWTKNTSTMNNGEDYAGWNNAGIRDIIGTGFANAIFGGFSNISGTVSVNPHNYFMVNTLGNNDVLYLPKVVWNNKTQTQWIADAIDIQIIIPLATPFTVQLTPAQLSTLIGQNVLWCDTGDSTAIIRTGAGALAYQDTVDYNSDQITNKPNLTAIKSMIGGYESSMKATRNYISGQLIVVADTLYKATSNIASGTTLTAGSNVSATTVDAELALKAKTDDVYTKSFVDTLLAAKAPLASPALTGTPTAPTPSASDDSTQIATTAMVQDVAEGKEDLIIKSASGAVASFADGADYPVSELIVDIDPVQDLHGYANPWPAGGGSNIWDEEWEVGQWTNLGIKADGTSIRSKNYIPVTSGTTYYASFSKTTYTTGLIIQALAEDKSFIENHLMYNPGTFTVGANTKYIVMCTFVTDNITTYTSGIAINYPSTVTTYSPYSNVCPISGHTSAMVTRTGKNLAKSKEVTELLNLYGIALYIDTDLLLPSTTYTISFDGTSGNKYYLNENLFVYSTFTVGSGRTIVQATTLSALDKTNVRQYEENHGWIIFKNHQAQSNAHAFDDLQLELGSTANAYQPYSGVSVTVDLNGTIYGGTVDVLTGEMTVTKAVKVLNGTEGWTQVPYNSWPTYPYAYQVQVSGVPIFSSKGSCISSHYNNGNPYHNLGNLLNLYDNYLVLADNQFEDVTALKTWLSTNNVTVVYPLATPLTVQLTPAQLSTLLGANNIWSDTGNTTVKYWTLPSQDLADDIQRKVDAKADVIISSASGSVASFTDGSPAPVTALSVGIEPVQDLHGYSNPWPGGGGKNILPITIANLKTWNTGGTWNGDKYTRLDIEYTFETYQGYVTKIIANGTASGNATLIITADSTHNEYVGKIFSGKPSVNGTTMSGYNFTTSSNLPNDTGDGITLSGLTDNVFRLYVVVASGYTVTNATFQPMIRDTSETSTYTPYSNICPISGHSNVVVTRTGKNLLQNINSASVTSNGVTFTKNADGSLTLSGTASANAFYNMDYTGGGSTSVFDLTPFRGQQMTLSMVDTAITGLTINFTYFTDNVTYPTLQSNINTKQTVTIPSDAWRSRIYIKVASGTAFATPKTIYPQLVLGTEVGEIQPYTATSVTIDLGGTRYGGQLDVLTGEMVIDRAYITFNGSENWYSSARTNVTPSIYRLALSNVLTGCKQITAGNLLPELISNIYPTKSPNNTYDGILGISNQQNTNDIYVYDPNFDYQYSTSAFTTWLGSNNLQVVYKLAQPLTVQLSPSTLSTLLGDNNIWASTGQTSVTYRADTKLFIERLTKPTEDDMVANTNIASGKYFMVGNNLYLATSAIASGTMVVPGSNCTALSLADALNNLNS